MVLIEAWSNASPFRKSGHLSLTRVLCEYFLPNIPILMVPFSLFETDIINFFNEERIMRRIIMEAGKRKQFTSTTCKCFFFGGTFCVEVELFNPYKRIHRVTEILGA